MHMCVFVQSKRVNSFNHFDCVISLWLLNVKKKPGSCNFDKRTHRVFSDFKCNNKGGQLFFFLTFLFIPWIPGIRDFFKLILSACALPKKKLGDLSAHPIFYLLVVSLNFDYFVRWILLL